MKMHPKAKYLALNKDGVWWSYEDKPIYDEQTGCWGGAARLRVKVSLTFHVPTSSLFSSDASLINLTPDPEIGDIVLMEIHAMHNWGLEPTRHLWFGRVKAVDEKFVQTASSHNFSFDREKGCVLYLPDPTILSALWITNHNLN